MNTVSGTASVSVNVHLWYSHTEGLNTVLIVVFYVHFFFLRVKEMGQTGKSKDGQFMSRKLM